ncbi:probable NADP-dependent mannitol dehydrogenase [Trichomonascus vanleenenianus]|uniref:SDR family NAD(P)-dependent oxidoreductase n=1 Tax=Trichomonascus vanleenenianus TaxID=2268995 RepID=UPI003EC9B3B7
MAEEIKTPYPFPAWNGDDASIPADQKAKVRFSLAGKNAVITGGASGLGLQIAYGYLEHDIDGLVLLDVNEQNLKNAQKQLKRVHPHKVVEIFACDVSDHDQVKKSVEFSAKVLKTIDILVAFAGIGGIGDGDVTSIESWKKIMEVNASGVFYTCKYYGEFMIQQKRGGSMILASSVLGHGKLGSGNAPIPFGYSSAKAAVLSLKASFATTYGPHGIRVNTVSPGFMDTPIVAGLKEVGMTNKNLIGKFPAGRYGQPGEIVGALVLLASNAGSYISGANLFIDGGMTARL